MRQSKPVEPSSSGVRITMSACIKPESAASQYSTAAVVCGDNVVVSVTVVRTEHPTVAVAQTIARVARELAH